MSPGLQNKIQAWKPIFVAVHIKDLKKFGELVNEEAGLILPLIDKLETKESER